ncbi:MAG: helix-turn-helix domain-containing protein [Chloroflexi bacterium]|nr:helix-turn-helix domain-containing protein [Chloroflexota bacterium]
MAVHHGLVLRADQGSGAVCAQMLAALAAQAPLLSPAQRQALGDSALDTLVVWLRGEHLARAHLSPRHSEQLAAICDYIECYLDDDQLCPRTLANRFGISVRYLHRLFAPTGTSVARWIAIRRLETIRGELLQRGGSRGTIRDVATRWGFHDMAHFSRAFRQHFGEPPWSYLRRRTGRVPHVEL